MKRLAFFLLVVLTAAAASAQKHDRVADSLELSVAKGGLPIWSQPDVQPMRELAGVAQRGAQGIVILGNSHAHGTGFVISRQYRLVATNAHVADIRKMGQMLAIINGTTLVYPVIKAWYHPGVGRRLADNPSMVVRSTNPNDGSIEPMSPDMAVLQLADAGPDLPVEMEMATPEELDKLFAQPVAMLGFPGHDTMWPGMGEAPEATYHSGVVSRLTDFHLKPNVPNDEKQFVQYTMATWGGFSGSPIVLPNGHVAAIHNMARTASAPSGVVQSIPHGIRIDCLRELLVHWKLDDRVPIGVDRSQVHVDHWLKPDPHEQDYRRAMNLDAEAWTLIFGRKNLAEGADRCNKALALAPNYAHLYWLRAAAFNMYVFEYSGSLSYDKKAEQLEAALRDARTYVKMAPSDPQAYLRLAEILNNYGYESKQHTYNQQAFELANSLLKSSNIDKWVRGGAMSSRAIAYGNLGMPDDAVREYGRAIEANPEDPVLWENRASYWDNNDRSDLAASDRQRAKELRDKY